MQTENLEQAVLQNQANFGTTPELEEAKAQEVTLSPEQQMQELQKVAVMRHKVLSQLVRVHLADLMNDLAFKSGISGAQKVALINQTLDGIEGVLDLGVDITNTVIPEKGPVGTRVAKMAGVLAQALDNRMLILAHRMENETQNVEQTNNTEETQNVQSEQ